MLEEFMLDINLVSGMMAWAYLFAMSCLVGLGLNFVGFIILLIFVIPELIVHSYDYNIWKEKRRVDREFVKEYNTPIRFFIPFYTFYMCIRHIILWESCKGSVEQKLHKILDDAVERTWQKIDKSSGK